MTEQADPAVDILVGSVQYEQVLTTVIADDVSGNAATMLRSQTTHAFCADGIKEAKVPINGLVNAHTRV